MKDFIPRTTKHTILRWYRLRSHTRSSIICILNYKSMTNSWYSQTPCSSKNSPNISIKVATFSYFHQQSKCHGRRLSIRIENNSTITLANTKLLYQLITKATRLFMVNISRISHHLYSFNKKTIRLPKI